MVACTLPSVARSNILDQFNQTLSTVSQNYWSTLKMVACTLPSVARSNILDQFNQTLSTVSTIEAH